MSLSFKKFMQFVNLDGEVSDDQINEIFGLFKNNAKVDALKKEREKLKGMSASKKAELDQALKDFAAGRKTAVTDRVKGALKDVDWDEVLGADDRKYLAKRDRESTESAVKALNKTGRNFYEHFDEGLNEGKVNVKAFKVEIPPGITDSAIWDFIEDQSVVTIEDFERKGKVVYFYPHFDHDYDPHMAGAMQAAFNRFAKQEGLTEAKYFDVPLDNDSDSDRAWEHAMETIRSDEQYHGKIHTDDVYHICKDAADAADLSEHDFNELRGAVEVYLKKERRLVG